MEFASPTVFRKPVYLQYHPAYNRVFGRVVQEAISFHKMKSALSAHRFIEPITIAIDGPPGAGKTTFARRFANYVNLTMRGLLAVYVFQMDYFLSGMNRKLDASGLRALPPEKYTDPAFWYRFDDVDFLTQSLRSIRTGDNVILRGLHEPKTDRFDKELMISYPENRYPLFVIEGVYSLHERFTENVDLGIFFWSGEWLRHAQYTFRAKMRGSGDQERAEVLYDLSNRCYLSYLENGFEKYIDLLAVIDKIDLRGESEYRGPIIQKLDGTGWSRFLNIVASEIEAGSPVKA